MSQTAPRSTSFRVWLFPALLLLLTAGSITLNGGLWLSSDSLNYISLARGILEGNWYTNYDTTSATWPLGYPALIAATYALTGSASAGLILLQAALVIILGFLYQEVAHRLGLKTGLFGLLMLFSLLFTVLLTAWSELLFINLLLALILLLTGTYTYRGLLLFICMFLLIETRYIGVCMVPVVLVYGYWKQGFSFRKFPTELGALLAVPLPFLVHYFFTGQFTGPQRGPNHDPILTIFLYAGTSFHAAKVYFRVMTTGLVLLALFLAFRKYRPGRLDLISVVRHPAPTWRLPGLLALSAAAYVGLLVGLRILTHFDMINFRLMAPVTVIVSFAILWLYQVVGKYARLAMVMFVALALADQYRTQLFSTDHPPLDTSLLLEKPAEAPPITCKNAKILFSLTGIRATQDPSADKNGWTIYNQGVSNLTQVFQPDFISSGNQTYSLQEWLRPGTRNPETREEFIR